MSDPVTAGRQLKLTRRVGRGGVVVSLSGVIDETLSHAALTEGLRGITVFDLDGVTRITSYGVREWTQALKGVPSDYSCFVNCRPIVISQFNTVANFGGAGQVVSLYAPFVCHGCGKEFDKLIDLRRTHAEVAAFQPPKAQCPACGADAELDDVPESYFSFVAAAPRPTPSPVATALIDNDEVAFSVPFKVEKEVVGNVTALWTSGSLDRSAHLKRIVEGLEGKVVAVFAGVVSASPEGVARLAPLVKLEGVEVWLARVPPPLAERLAEEPQSAGAAKLCSVALPFRCPSCNQTVMAEVEPRLLERFESCAPGDASCPHCLGPVTPIATLAQVATARRLKLEAPPDEVRTYLSDHPDGIVLEVHAVEAEEEEVPLPFDVASQPSKPPARPPPPPDEALALTANASNPASFGRYTLVKKIGAGGMAEIFLARQSGPMGFEKRVVLKRILPNLSADTDFVNMFLQEARVAARLSHPNVVQIFDLGKVGSQYFIAMEYVKGWDLNLILKVMSKARFQMPVELACRVVADLCAGLHAAHTCVDPEGKSLNIVHRDVSPHNVLISVEGTVKITDFGIARVSDSIGHTLPGQMKGKLGYMAPEVVRGETAIDGRADIFAAGVILYQLVTQESVFRRESEAATLSAVVSAPVPRMSSKRPGVPEALEAIVDRALARETKARYQTALELQQALEAFLMKNGKPSSAAALSVWLQEISSSDEAVGGGEGFTPVAFTPTNRPKR